MGRLRALAIKELHQLRRDRLTLGMMVGIPLVQLLLFGYAIDTDVRHMPTVVFDQDQSEASRDLVRSMEVTGYFDVVGYPHSYDEVQRALRSDDAKVGIVIPSNFSHGASGIAPTVVQFVVDGSDPQTAGSAVGTATSLLQARSAALQVRALEAKGVRTAAPTLNMRVSTWYNPDLRTAVFVVPGLIGVILTMTMVMLTAMAIARERERGTLEALIVSPLGRLEMIVGKITPYIIIGYVQIALVLTAGRVVFDVPIVGSTALLFGLSTVFIAANLAIGLLFSTVAQTQQQAMQMSFFFLLPNILLSGFMFPFEAMPIPAQYLAEVLPLTHFLRIVRGITLKGAGLFDVLDQVLQLGALLGVIVLLASVRFKKKLV